MTQLLKNKGDIDIWLQEHGVGNYQLIADKKYGHVVNVREAVDLRGQELRHIAVKFNHIEGFFDCSTNELTSLKGCPISVNGEFACQDNRLKSLRYCPAMVLDNFDCSSNQLTSLAFGPVKVEQSFSCYNNQLTTLEHCPIKVGSDFCCGGNKITSLEFCPAEVGGKFYCISNPLLKEAQNINDFDKIYQLHLEIANIKKERQMLKELIQPTNNPQAVERFKI